mmetsp:Transcript_14865/g.29846  ORF Transcript_14865/g.29846 Transcript_14865/m.29846 type:complete len:211 (+) Transcript_14865:3-635(+)
MSFRKLFSSSANTGRDPDFNEEAVKIFNRLGNPQGSVGRFNACDPIWRHPTSGGTVYVGNVEAASNLGVLKQHGITHVVNCTDNMPMYHSKTGQIEYLQFDIASWSRYVRGGSESFYQFTNKMFQFVGETVSDGKHVLVHCLAGAHRAGTTGCLLLMHFAALDAHSAVALAKRLRPIIDPIGSLPELLKKAEEANRANPARERFPIKHFE